MAGTLAIDLGSTTTVVAWQAPGQDPCLLALSPYSTGDPPLVPSLLWQATPEQAVPLLGRQVLEAGLVEQGGPGLSRDFKRWIGQRPVGGAAFPQHAAAAGVSAAAAPVTGGAANAGPEPSGGPSGWLSPEQAGERLLHALWQALPAAIQPQRLVLTAPVDAYPGYRRWLQQACAALAVPEVALVDEPTAAAIGAGLPPGSRVLVVDVGGGTTDLALVELQGGEGRAAPIAQLLRFAGRDLERSGQALRTARVIGKAGLAFGGRDIDRWIAAHLLPDQPLDSRLLQAAERLKIALSTAESALQVWSDPAGGVSRELRLHRDALQQLLQERGLEQLLDHLLEEVLAAARREGLGQPRIDAVLPVGGSSQLPAIRRWLEQRLPGVPLRAERPVQAVALGALALTPGVAVRDVLRRGVSLRCWDRRSGRHHWHPLFLPGQSWPTLEPMELVLAASCDGQTTLELVLGEPEPEDRQEVVFRDGVPVLRTRSCGSGRMQPWAEQPGPLPLTPSTRAGEDQLRLRFSIDGSGQLLLTAEDLRSGLALPPRRLGPVR